MRYSPNKLVMHEDGRMSVRIGGRWQARIIELSPTDYLALPRADRQRVVLAEFETGRSHITGYEPIVTRYALSYND